MTLDDFLAMAGAAATPIAVFIGGIRAVPYLIGAGLVTGIIRFYLHERLYRVLLNGLLLLLYVWFRVSFLFLDPF